MKRLIFALFGIVTLSSCSLLRGNRLGDHAVEVVRPGDELPQQPAAVTPPVISFATLVRSLELGDIKSARSGFSQFIKKHPNSIKARDLLNQIEWSSSRYFGKISAPYIIKRGDSLEKLSRKYLANGLKFYALAKFNHIRVPSNIQLGQKIRIPFLEIKPGSVIRKGAERATIAALVAGARLFEQTGDAATALKCWNQIVSIHPGYSLARANINRLNDQHYWKQQLAKISAFQRQGKYDDMYQELRLVRQQYPKRFKQNKQIFTYIQSTASYFHKEALFLYHRQELEPAIKLWDQALELRPDFEAASVYRTRARELLKRLKRL